MRLTPKILAVCFLLVLLLALDFLLLHQRRKPVIVESPVVAAPIDDEFWLKLDRRRSDLYRKQLQAAPAVLVVRESHYAFNPTNGMGMHYGWVDNRRADLHISFSELVGCAYRGDYAHTEFPDAWTQGHMTNTFDVIATVPDHPQEALQAEARRFLKQRFGLAWHLATKDTDVLLIRSKNRSLLESKATRDFAHSTAISELALALENFFGRPVIDETGATNRYDHHIEEVPARWVNGRTTDLDANNQYLAGYGLELTSDRRPQKWLVVEQASQ